MDRGACDAEGIADLCPRGPLVFGLVHVVDGEPLHGVSEILGQAGEDDELRGGQRV